MNDYILKIATYERFLEANHGKEAYCQDKRQPALIKFPYKVITEGYHPVHEYSTRWCWQNFGDKDCKECAEHYSEYPGCPLVLATEEYVIKRSHPDSSGVIRTWEEKSRKPSDHGHEGTWTTVWLGKTGYDYGFMEWYFDNETDLNTFVNNIPSFGLGENYED